MDLLRDGNHVDPLVQQLFCLFIEEAILSHLQVELDPHHALMCVCEYGKRWRSEEGGQLCGRVWSRNFQDTPYMRAWKKDAGRKRFFPP